MRVVRRPSCSQVIRTGKRAAPRTAPISLIVLHSDPQPAADSLATWTAPDARNAPHFFVSAIGTTTQLVPETRAAQHSGSAMWQGHEQDIDQISIGITLELEGRKAKSGFCTLWIVPPNQRKF